MMPRDATPRKENRCWFRQADKVSEPCYEIWALAIAGNKGENPLSLANQAHEIAMHWAGVGSGSGLGFAHPTNNGGDASVLLPTFRRAIIAFLAQLPLLYGQCAHLGGATHTHDCPYSILFLSLPPFPIFPFSRLPHPSSYITHTTCSTAMTIFPLHMYRQLLTLSLIRSISF